MDASTFTRLISQFADVAATVFNNPDSVDIAVNGEIEGGFRTANTGDTEGRPVVVGVSLKEMPRHDRQKAMVELKLIALQLRPEADGQFVQVHPYGGMTVTL
jgi:hypothetical protein